MSVYLWLRTGPVAHAYTVTDQMSLCGRGRKPANRRFTRGGVPCGLCRLAIRTEREGAAR